MSTEVYEFGDGHGNSFRISIEVSYSIGYGGSWRTIDKGYIRYNSGKTQSRRYKKSGDNDFDLRLICKEGTYGMELTDYQDFWGLNDQGKGTLHQSWAMKMKPGTISWSHVE